MCQHTAFKNLVRYVSQFSAILTCCTATYIADLVDFDGESELLISFDCGLDYNSKTLQQMYTNIVTYNGNNVYNNTVTIPTIHGHAIKLSFAHLMVI